MGDKLICITKNRKAMKIIILHDADARIEYLDVADHLLGSDIEEFLTRHGLSHRQTISQWFTTSMTSTARPARQPTPNERQNCKTSLSTHNSRHCSTGSRTS